MATRANYIGYPYKAIPMFPIHFGMDPSLVPVLFILMYQYTLIKSKFLSPFVNNNIADYIFIQTVTSGRKSIYAFKGN